VRVPDRRYGVRKSWTALISLAATVVVWPGIAQKVAADRLDWAGGQAAVSRLGDRLPAVAARNSLSAAELRSNLLTDPTLLVDAQDQLLYVEPAAEQAELAEAALGAEAAAIDPAAALTLHSRPGSSRVIYVDFDGQTLANTAWNGKTGGACYADPYDSDGVPTAFSQTELAAIAGVWARVAEDYAPFDVDVTTVDPGASAITRSSQSDSRYGTRVVVTRSVSMCPNGKTLYASVCSGGCGGIAYVGVFDQTSNHAYYQPALVFQNGVGSGQKNVAEAAAHEAGHNLGLSHDGTATSAYYSGHGSWAPIMGVGYYKAITQWSKGEYAGANQTQDDLAVIQSNGARTIRDDFPENRPAALDVTSPVAGIITTRTDVDVFSVTVTQQSTITVTATPAASSPNLDIALTPGGFGGGVTVNPRSGSTSGDVATDMDASISATVPPGTYTVRVDGGGAAPVDSVDTGYSDYASLGAYTVSLTVA
jgi:Metallo-peptidase family M12B Reprolysin-like